MEQQLLSELSDNEVVKLTLDNQEIYAELVRRYHDKLLRYIKSLGCRSADDAEDVLQEVFIKAYRNLNDYDISLKLSSWLYRIAHNQTISFFRKVNVRPQPLAKEEDLILLDFIQADIDLSADLDQKYLADNLEGILNKLDEKYRRVLVLKYLEAKSYEEISDILQKPLGTVATLLNRAKTKFKKELDNSKINI
jgi:RNA polymerase sigma-70 factor (ECF subfamily)